MIDRRHKMRSLVVGLLGVAGAALVSVPTPRAVVSFELDDVLWDAKSVRSGARSELQDWLRGRLRPDRQSSFEPMDAYEAFDALKKKGEEFGFMLPGIITVQREALKIVVGTESGLPESEHEDVANEALAQWLQSHDAFAEMSLEPGAVEALQALRDSGIACCAVTNSIGDTARMPSLAPLVDQTICTYEFTTGASEAWEVAFQVMQARYAMGTPWIHVGRAKGEGGVAQLATPGPPDLGIRTVALGPPPDRDEEHPPTTRAESLTDLVAVVEGLLEDA